MAAKIQDGHLKKKEISYTCIWLWKSEINKWGVNSGVSGVTEIDAGHGILLRSPISKMAAKFQNGRQYYNKIHVYDRNLDMEV